jgi:adenylate cyclase
LIRVTLSVAFAGVLLAHIGGYVPIAYIDSIEKLLYDSRLRYWAPGGQDLRIVIVAIDEASLSEQGHWPWTRDKLALLVERLFEYGVAVVGFDIVFAERDESADLDRLLELATGPDDDEFRLRLDQLAPAMDRDRLFSASLETGPVVLGYYFDTSVQGAFETGQLPPPAFELDESMLESVYLPRATGFGANLEELMSSAYSAGFVSNPLIDSDGVVRRVPLLNEYKSGVYEAFSLAIVSTFLNDIAIPSFIEVPGVARNYPSLQALEIADKRIPLDAQGAVLVPYLGPAGSFPYVSATEIMSGKLADPEILANTIALVGATAPGILDLRSTPFGSVFPGVEIHANLISGILDDRIFSVPAYTLAAEFVTVVGLGLVCAFMFPLLSPLLASVAVVLMTASVLGANMYLWSHYQNVLPLATSLVTLFGIYVLNMIFGYFFESRSRLQMNDLFGQYVPPDLVREMSNNPTNYSLASEKRELTVLFTDIRGFTSISEKLDASDLSRLMDQFLTPMTRIIHERQGTIDKYMGDAIMAFWGAPVMDPDHAAHAVAAALEMLDSLEELNRHYKEQDLPELRIGIGINTGSMSVGNMGSQFRRAYTVLGDAVNLGSRLEGLTKTYGTRVNVGETTRDCTPGYTYREIDRVRVKGKSEAVTIYEVIGLTDELSQEDSALALAFDDFLALYRQQDWDNAEEAIEQLVSRDRESVLYTLYRQRIQLYRDDPPAPDWDGVFTHESK